MSTSEPEVYYVICQFNSQGRLCNLLALREQDGEGVVKVSAEEWERFSQLAGRQHEVIDGWAVYNLDLEPCLPDDMLMERIAELQKQLAETDYKIVKCSEYQLAGLELPYDIAALHTERQALRDQINAFGGMAAVDS